MPSISNCNPSINLFAQKLCALLEKKNEMRPANNTQNHARLSIGLILPLAGLMSAAILVLGTAGVASAQAVYPSWSLTGNLNIARRLYTATLLQNGKVLVTGGLNNMDDSCNRGNCF